MKVNIVFENGHVFMGERFGAERDSLGEVIFTTSSTGYIEDLTDPCYRGQIIMPVFPSLGNYGMIFQDRLSGACQCAGVITRDACPEPSNFRSEGTVADFLLAEGIPGVSGVDTRAITKLLRDGRALRAAITSRSPEEVLPEIRAFRFNAYKHYESSCAPGVYAPAGGGRVRVALIDLGAARRQLDALLSLGCEVVVAPLGTPVSDILMQDCRGAVFSEGPGDPADYAECLPAVRAFFGELPIFGVGLGHQLISLAYGLKVTRLRPGHHGSNVPVRDLETGKVDITTQNHGFCVSAEGLPPTVRLLCENCHDGSVEGLLFEEFDFFTLQFSPETGNRAPQWGYQRFIEMLED